MAAHRAAVERTRARHAVRLAIVETHAVRRAEHGLASAAAARRARRACRARRFARADLQAKACRAPGRAAFGADRTGGSICQTCAVGRRRRARARRVARCRGRGVGSRRIARCGSGDIARRGSRGVAWTLRRQQFDVVTPACERDQGNRGHPRRAHQSIPTPTRSARSITSGIRERTGSRRTRYRP